MNLTVQSIEVKISVDTTGPIQSFLKIVKRVIKNNGLKFDHPLSIILSFSSKMIESGYYYSFLPSDPKAYEIYLNPLNTSQVYHGTIDELSVIHVLLHEFGHLLVNVFLKDIMKDYEYFLTTTMRGFGCNTEYVLRTGDLEESLVTWISFYLHYPKKLLKQDPELYAFLNKWIK